MSEHEPGLPHLADLDAAPNPMLLAEEGRRLLLVDALADEWAVGVAQGMQVWFRLNAKDRSFRSEWRCHSDQVDRVRLESGRYAHAIPGPWDLVGGT